MMGERLRSCRTAKRLTMKEFAEACGISERYLADIERGLKAPKLETLLRIVNVSGVSMDYLFQDSLLLEKSDEMDVQNALVSFAPVQQKIICDFITQLADSLK